MKLQVSEQNGISIISLQGKIMGGPEAGQINDHINTLLDSGKKDIIVDLEEVEWMNSSGLGILIGIVTTLKNSNGRLVLVNVSERIENLLKITKLQDVFSIEKDIQAALSSF